MNKYFKEKQIKVRINTNLNMKKQSEPEDTYITLSSSMIKIMESSIETLLTLEEYPYFTAEVEYPWIYLQTLPYRRMIEFFFNRQSFIKILTEQNLGFVNTQFNKYNTYLKNSENNVLFTTNESNNAEMSKYDEKNKIVQKNIVIMMKCLFPTKYPYKTNIKTSYDIKIRKYPQLNLDVSQSFIKLFRITNNDKDDAAMHPEYSYLSLEGKIYTISEVIWINDIYNHPKYKKIVGIYHDLLDFKNTYSRILINEIKNKQDLIREFKNNNNTNAVQQLQNISREIQESNNANRRIYIQDIIIIDKLIKYIEKLNDFNYDTIETDVDAVYILYDDTKALINYISKYQSKIDDRYYYNPYFKLTKDISNLFENVKMLQENVNYIRENNYILENYLKKINKKIVNDKKIIENEENRKIFKSYLDFFNELKNFDNKKYPTNNRFLQDLIDNVNKIDTMKTPIANNDKTSNFIKLLNPSHIKDTNEPFKHFVKCIYTGVNEVEGAYEIYLRMDLIEGVVNDDNKKNIKCVYVGEKLTDKLDTLLSKQNEWELNPRRMFFVLDEMKGYSIVGGPNFDNSVGMDVNESAKYPEVQNTSNTIEEDKTENGKESAQVQRPSPPSPPPYFNPYMYRRGGGRKSKKIIHKLRGNTRKLKSYFMMN